MRLAVQTEDPDVQAEAGAFGRWVLSIGNGTIPAMARQGESDPTWISIPSEHLVHTDGPKIPAIVDVVYVDFLQRYSDPNYLKERAILTPTNDLAMDINDHVLSLVPGEEREYLSCDSTGNSADEARNIDVFYPTEVLNTIKVNNFPYHKLVLKKGVPIMLLRNISQAAGLCNGTRLIVTRLAEKLIEAVVMAGSNIGDIVYIPRICLTVRDPKWPFTLHRRQFPIRISYAMTVNKSQGQTLAAVGLYLKTPVFTHGQFYVAVSRVTSKKALQILIENEDGTCGSETRNIVFSEIFESLANK
ncbi:ATP-dependent DNA helicase PIF1 isoform X2 [Triticum aestivum]|uniref:ATP-dependent DNA helicase PIF1 isoform X2 n=1 Tax=Triticum aestivum TaxID=4565 RepID=UPI001D0072E0|nr:ATP-dependent DNA helicase PIF1-like isoform X2 [Triticum aestivum]